MRVAEWALIGLTFFCCVLSIQGITPVANNEGIQYRYIFHSEGMGYAFRVKNFEFTRIYTRTN